MRSRSILSVADCISFLAWSNCGPSKKDTGLKYEQIEPGLNLKLRVRTKETRSVAKNIYYYISGFKIWRNISVQTNF